MAKRGAFEWALSSGSSRKGFGINPTASIGLDNTFASQANTSVVVAEIPLWNLQKTPGVLIHRIGGGVKTIQVEGSIVRANQGDAEWWAFKFFEVMGRSALGKLSIDNWAIELAMFESGAATFSLGLTSCIVNYSMTFKAGSHKVVSNSVGFSPGDDAQYEGRTSNNDYVFGGVNIGVEARLASVSVSRELVIKHLPRGFGARIKNIVKGRRLSFSISTIVKPQWTAPAGPTTPSGLGGLFYERSDVEEDEDRIASSVIDQKAVLAGNGNEFNRVVIRSIRPQISSSPFTEAMTIEAEQDLQGILPGA